MQVRSLAPRKHKLQKESFLLTAEWYYYYYDKSFNWTVTLVYEWAEVSRSSRKIMDLPGVEAMEASVSKL
jgi:hypothetical protein